jgi:Cu-Zn family superoxide dismutase
MKALTPLTLATALLFAPACDDEAASGGGDAAVVADSAAPGPDTGSSTTTDAGAPADVAAGETAPGAGDAAPTGDAFTTSSGAWVVYEVPDAGTPAMGIMGSAAAYALAGDKTRVVLSVTGLAASTTYGAHVHKLACTEMMAGGHYQNMPPPATVDASASDPMYGNSMNEIWLDFTTDAAGKGMADTTVGFRVRAGEAKAIVVHKMMTAMGGLAGPKLACLPIAF